jgi:hypothetical protein
MNRAAAWGLIGVAVVVLAGALLLVASYRFAIALVEPPLPVPDYGIQAAVAYITAGCIAAGGVVVALLVNRQGTAHGRTVGLGVGALAAVALVGTVLAFVLSAR